jgi:hypothetical protein
MRLHKEQRTKAGTTPLGTAVMVLEVTAGVSSTFITVSAGSVTVTDTTGFKRVKWACIDNLMVSGKIKLNQIILQTPNNQSS